MGGVRLLVKSQKPVKFETLITNREYITEMVMSDTSATTVTVVFSEDGTVYYHVGGGGMEH